MRTVGIAKEIKKNKSYFVGCLIVNPFTRLLSVNGLKTFRKVVGG